jgi:hypothetical protein
MCSSPNITRIIKPRRMKWVGHVARMLEMKNAYNFGGPTTQKDIKMGQSGYECMDWIQLTHRWVFNNLNRITAYSSL